ncbi:hypothetical protein TPA0908_50780 [Micromonospora sp. AKA38]|nr:hypothetical protein TPA0908_50780 [Micromonospora sp. AKA38]
MRPQPGDLLRIDGRASVQFGGDRALTLRVVSVGPELTHLGWIWLTGYVLDRHGLATAKREIFVQLAGLRPATPARPSQRSPSLQPSAKQDTKAVSSVGQLPSDRPGNEMSVAPTMIVALVSTEGVRWRVQWQPGPTTPSVS